MKKTVIFSLLVSLFGFHFSVCNAQATELTNLVVFLRFADDDEINHSFDEIDEMFNSREPGYLSVYNFYDALTYGKIHYNTVYTNNIQNGVIVSYVDIMPRAYFQPYSPSNPIGYQPEEQPFMGVSMREAQLLGRVARYVDSLHLVDDTIVLDGDGDGDIDNLSFIVKGGTGEWASILWPHMEYFPHDSLGYITTINGVRANAFNMEFEGSTEKFSANVFRHEMGHSLDMPDLYHYINYTDVSPAYRWDMMHNATNPNHTNAFFKNKILHVADDPIEITCDGDYTLYSVGSSSTQISYYIKSSIDSTQWFTFEYRNKEDLFEEGIPGTGLIAGRWSDTVPLDYSGMFANAFFDFYNVAHQYWIFRPNSAIDTVEGLVNRAHFSAATGRTSFGPNTNPHPYLTDGTPETSFEITNIQENGNTLTFHVHFLEPNGIDEPENTADAIDVRVDGDRIVVEESGTRIADFKVYDVMGRGVKNHDLTSGVYIVKVGDYPAKKVVVVK